MIVRNPGGRYPSERDVLDAILRTELYSFVRATFRDRLARRSLHAQLAYRGDDPCPRARAERRDQAADDYGTATEPEIDLRLGSAPGFRFRPRSYPADHLRELFRSTW